MGEAFHKGDRLRVRMRVVQRQTLKGLQTERRVLEVIEHYHEGSRCGLMRRPGCDTPAPLVFRTKLDCYR
jgi:hypothetical protein